MDVKSASIIIVVFTNYISGNAEIGILNVGIYQEKKQCDEVAERIKAHLDDQLPIIKVQANGTKVEVKCVKPVDVPIPNCAMTSEIWRTTSKIVNDFGNFGGFKCCEPGTGEVSVGCTKLLKPNY